MKANGKRHKTEQRIGKQKEWIVRSEGMQRRKQGIKEQQEEENIEVLARFSFFP